MCHALNTVTTTGHLMKINDLFEFAQTPRNDGDDDDLHNWKKIFFNGENVFYRTSLVSFNKKDYGLQIQLAVIPRANNAESVFVHRRELHVFGKSADIADSMAEKLAFAWLAANGTDELHKAKRDWDKDTDAFNKSQGK